MQQSGFFSARARLGLAAGRFLVTASGGAATTHVEGGFFAEALFADGVSRAQSQRFYLADEQVLGWTLGAAVEFAIAENVALKLDYQHADFGSLALEDAGGPTTGPANVDVDLPGMDVVTAGLTLSF